MISFSPEAYDTAARFIKSLEGYYVQVYCTPYGTWYQQVFDAIVIDTYVGQEGQYQVVLELTDEDDEPSGRAISLDIYDELLDLEVY